MVRVFKDKLLFHEGINISTLLHILLILDGGPCGRLDAGHLI